MVLCSLQRVFSFAPFLVAAFHYHHLHNFFIRLSKLRNNPINLALDIFRWLMEAHAQFSRPKSQQSSKLKPQV
jgi:hypothetical protein